MRRPLKPVTLTQRQIENALDALFNIDEPVIPRTKMSAALYDYAWTVWASRRDIKHLQGERAHVRSKRRRQIIATERKR